MHDHHHHHTHNTFHQDRLINSLRIQNTSCSCCYVKGMAMPDVFNMESPRNHCYYKLTATFRNNHFLKVVGPFLVGWGSCESTDLTSSVSVLTSVLPHRTQDALQRRRSYTPPELSFSLRRWKSLLLFFRDLFRLLSDHKQGPCPSQVSLVVRHQLCEKCLAVAIFWHIGLDTPQKLCLWSNVKIPSFQKFGIAKCSPRLVVSGSVKDIKHRMIYDFNYPGHIKTKKIFETQKCL